MNRRRHPARSRRVAAVAGLATVATLAGVLPADAHPSFGSDVNLGFGPNVTGGTGQGNVAPPYGPNKQVTLTLKLPDEVPGAFTSQDNSTTKAVVRIPSGWTNPACGEAMVDAAVPVPGTNPVVNSSQPGATYAATCVLSTVTLPDNTTRQQLTWTMAQNGSATDKTGPQWFRFQVTTPTVATLTRFGALPDTGTPAVFPAFTTGEGFFSKQVYADADETADTGNIRNWFAPNTSIVKGQTPGSTNATNTQDVAGGLTRTVAAVDPPTGTPGNQSISATIPAPTGNVFSLSIPNNQPVTLTAGAATGTYYPFSGSLNKVTVTDSRATGSTWSVAGQASAFDGAVLGADSAKYLGWTPSVLAGSGAGAVKGGQVFGALESPAGPGLGTAAPLATGTSGAGNPQASLTAAMTLRLPAGIPGGTYSTLVTVTAI